MVDINAVASLCLLKEHMFIFAWIGHQCTSLVVFDQAKDLQECVEVEHSEDRGPFPRRELRNASLVSQALGPLVAGLLLEQGGPMAEKTSLWFVNPSNRKLSPSEKASKFYTAGCIHASIEQPGGLGFLEGPILPMSILRRRVFEALTADEISEMMLEDASAGLIEALAIGLHYTGRMKAHAAPMGLA